MGFFKKFKFWRKREEIAVLKKHVEVLGKIIEELLKTLEKKDRERDEVEATLQGRIRELEEQIAAKGGEMDAHKQRAEDPILEETVQVQVEEIKEKEQLFLRTQEEESAEETLQEQAEDLKEKDIMEQEEIPSSCAFQQTQDYERFEETLQGQVEEEEEWIVYV